jgi:hypothetical protein
MKSARTAFSSIPHGGETICVDTCYVIPDEGRAFFETAARWDRSPFIESRPWHIFERYRRRDQALAGHRRWAQKVREDGLPEASSVSGRQSVGNSPRAQ